MLVRQIMFSFFPLHLTLWKKSLKRKTCWYCCFDGRSDSLKLNCTVKLYRNGIFDKYNVEVLGTPIYIVINIENRQLFSDRLNKIDEKIAESYAVDNIPDAIAGAKKLDTH